MTIKKIIQVLEDKNADSETMEAAFREAFASLNSEEKAQVFAYANALLAEQIAEQKAENSRITH